MLISLKYVLFPPTTLNANHVIYERSVVWKLITFYKHDSFCTSACCLYNSWRGGRGTLVEAVVLSFLLLNRYLYLIYQIQQLLLRGVHAHGPHGVSQLGGVDGPAPVHVELVEGLLELGHLLLAHLLTRGHRRLQIQIQRLSAGFSEDLYIWPHIADAFLSRWHRANEKYS